MKLALLILVLLLQYFAPPVHAAFYQWIDVQGVTHFTDNPDKIPSRYRKKAKRLELSEEQQPPQTAAPEPQAPRAASPGAAAPGPAASGGHSEDWWRERFSALRTELKTLEKGLPDKQSKLTQLRRKRAIYMRAQDREAVNGMQDAITADEARIARLRIEIADLERQAVQAEVPAGWRQ